MFRPVKQLFIALLSFDGSLITKCLSLHSEPSMTRSAVIDLKILFNLFIINS